METLFKWQKKHRLNDRQLAELIHCDPSMISHIKAGRKRPSPELALKIEKATNGAVTKEELIWPQSPES